jgi:hypothetical protein
VEAS